MESMFIIRPTKTLTIVDISEIIKKAFLNSATPSGLMATGISLFSPDVLTDDGFAAMFVSHTGRGKHQPK
jgi:hypothetical protein